MFDLKNQLGIKSYSFRHITDNADVAAAVKECEVDGIDLSACHAVIAAGPSTQVDQVTALAAERTEWIVLRHVRRLFAEWTPHTFRNLPDRGRARNARNAGKPVQRKPYQIDGCHMYVDNSPTARKRWPDYYAGK